MKIVRIGQRKAFRNSDNCIVYEYPLKDKDINSAIAEISGRYPDHGYVTNRKCKELVYVLKGKGRLILKNKAINFKEGDMLLIKPNEAYYWQGNMTIIMPCTPAWYPEQHVEIK
jgi:mannose-6-phosphate isomerase-like protein (cupin superfamily)